MFFLERKLMNWLIFFALSFIWGSSFVLMKEGLIALTAYQVAAIRILSAGAVLIPFAWKAIKEIPKEKLGLVILSGLLGSFFPAFLFCVAETKIDSSLAGILNALTTLFTIVIGIWFFELKGASKKIVGVSVGFAGLILLFTGNGNIDFKNVSYSSLILLATIMYGINVNMVGRYMKGISSLNIATVAFIFLIVPCVFILYFTGYFSNEFNKQVWMSTTASAVLGIGGTAIASILFYMLIKRAGAVFSTMVTYGIPFVAVFWGLVLGEKITMLQVVSLGIILLGVYLANSNKNPLSRKLDKREKGINN
jgi:drug/metabolite transporter (DMT)-like permease